MKLTTSAGFRAIHKIIVILNDHLRLSCQAPSHSTILLWAKKYGYHQLSKTRDFSGDWVLIIDESVQFGQNKLLVIYGLRPSDIDFTRPLGFADLVPLAVASKPSWNGQAIYDQLMNIDQKLQRICYAVADDGNPIKKALKLSGIPHVYDITHHIAIVLKKIYQHEADFVSYTRKMARLRGSQCLGSMAHVLPPAQRVNSRFMNLKPISDWGMAVLRLLDQDEPDTHRAEKQALAWVAGYRGLINELARLNRQINQIQAIAKARGMAQQTIEECSQICSPADSPRIKAFQRGMQAYFDRLQSLDVGHDRIVCCSDIIESSFGKYKNYMQGNPMIGITDLALCTAAFTGKLEAGDIHQAFEQNRIADVSTWSQSNIAMTALSKRKQTLKMGRTYI